MNLLIFILALILGVFDGLLDKPWYSSIWAAFRIRDGLVVAS
ncbi:hypothetical protein JCM19231_5735 [Vibrio ishigakensis]|uniref:Uncharacterized protein n=1 Tax=Vibrio ishigakensis TaxID=1481914 RepID=A0A0B8QQY8_9VIBR|nr:hypothetical protein JCM19231_5735 [Vibrio ishigakensis]GAM77368.1 hypothetical protein JCM19241_1838 [Vibrio ishigakensis]